MKLTLDNIELVSFDLDDTLWDIDPVIQNAENKLYDWMQTETPRITQSCTVDQIRERRCDFLQLNPAYAVDVTALRIESLKSLFTEFDYPVDRIDEAFAVFYQYRSQVTLYPGAVSILENIGRHYRVAALTNGNADLGIVGIEHLFEDVQRATMSMAPKPAAAMFEETARILDVDLQDILHVGDNPVADVQGAKSVGAKSVWFNQINAAWPEHLERADLEVHGLADLLATLPKCQQAQA